MCGFYEAKGDRIVACSKRAVSEFFVELQDCHMVVTEVCSDHALAMKSYGHETLTAWRLRAKQGKL